MLKINKFLLPWRLLCTLQCDDVMNMRCFCRPSEEFVLGQQPEKQSAKQSVKEMYLQSKQQLPSVLDASSAWGWAAKTQTDGGINPTGFKRTRCWETENISHLSLISNQTPVDFWAFSSDLQETSRDVKALMFEEQKQNRSTLTAE